MKTQIEKLFDVQLNFHKLSDFFTLPVKWKTNFVLVSKYLIRSRKTPFAVCLLEHVSLLKFAFEIWVRKVWFWLEVEYLQREKKEMILREIPLIYSPYKWGLKYSTQFIQRCFLFDFSLFENFDCDDAGMV